jgi:hypothetical protein
MRRGRLLLFFGTIPFRPDLCITRVQGEVGHTDAGRWRHRSGIPPLADDSRLTMGVRSWRRKLAASSLTRCHVERRRTKGRTRLQTSTDWKRVLWYPDDGSCGRPSPWKGSRSILRAIATLAAKENAPQSTPVVVITVEMDAYTFISVVLIVIAAIRSANT